MSMVNSNWNYRRFIYETRIIVAGCRDFHGYQFIEETLDAYIKPLEEKWKFFPDLHPEWISWGSITRLLTTAAFKVSG